MKGLSPWFKVFGHEKGEIIKGDFKSTFLVH